MKETIIKSNLEKKSRNLYIGEQLTREMDELCFRLRALKRQNKDAFSSSYTRQGRIYVKRTKEGQATKIESEAELLKFFSQYEISLPTPPKKQQSSAHG